jgi:hypothetical protein
MKMSVRRSHSDAVLVIAIGAGLAAPASAPAEIPYQAGDWPKSFGRYVEPIPYDVDGDGDLELIVNDADEGIVVYRHDGSVYSVLPIPPESTYIREIAAAGDLQQDGIVDIVAITSAFPYDNRLRVWDDRGDCRYASCSILLESGSLNTHAGPTLYDLDADGDLEIIIPWIVDSTHHLKLIVIEAKRDVITTKWKRMIEVDENLSTATDASVGDIDGDRKPEIVFGSTGTWLEDGGFLFAFEANGRMVENWPVELDQGLEHPPVLGDLTGDGRLEIVVNGYGGIGVKVFDYRGELLWTAGGRGRTPAIADIDGDGDLEVLTQSTAYHHDGSWTGWNYSSANPNGISVGDIDADGYKEILLGGSGSDGLRAYHHDGTPVDGFPLYVNPNLRHTYMTPVLADLDRDGDLEVTVTGAYLAVWDLPGDLGKVDWPMYQQDGHRAGASGPSLVRTRVDRNGDGVVDASDLVAQIAAWGRHPRRTDDRHGDGHVGLTDLLELLANWGALP